MFSLITATIRFGLFALVILIAGNTIKIGSQTVSQVVNIQIHRVANTQIFREWVQWGKTKLNQVAASVEKPPEKITNTQSATETAINRSERQKLRDLLRSLNSAHRE